MILETKLDTKKKDYPFWNFAQLRGGKREEGKPTEPPKAAEEKKQWVTRIRVGVTRRAPGGNGR